MKTDTLIRHKPSLPASATTRDAWVDILRTTITVLVVAHHAALAYTTFSTFNSSVYSLSTNPVVDTDRAFILDVFVALNDLYFMSLMFLISGLFTARSIAKKTSQDFVSDRFRRLIIPFLFVGTPFTILAYFPSFITAHHDTSLVRHIIVFFTHESWPVGPPWFLWVLFLFNVVVIILKKLNIFANRKISAPTNRTIWLYLATSILVIWISYVLFAHMLGAYTWTGLGPFDFQQSRLLSYFIFFVIGVLVGNTDFSNQILGRKSLLVRNWWIFLLAALTGFCLLNLITYSSAMEMAVKRLSLAPFTGAIIYYTLYVLTQVLMCTACLTLTRRIPALDKHWYASLKENAYLIYLIHYPFVTWAQFCLTRLTLPAPVKFVTVFCFSIAASWALANLLRSNRLIRRYI